MKNTNSKDLTMLGKHDFDKEKFELASNWQGTGTFSVNIFMWVLKAKSKSEMKRTSCIVRVVGDTSQHEAILNRVTSSIIELDNGQFTGRRLIRLFLT